MWDTEQTWQGVKILFFRVQLSGSCLPISDRLFNLWTSYFVLCLKGNILYTITVGRVETESGGTRRCTGGEVKEKEANGVGSQQSSAWLRTVHPVLLQSFSPDPHSKKASTRLNWHPRRYKWTRPFRWKTESGFCACAITFSFHSTRSFPWVKCGRGVLLTTHPLLVSRSWKSRAIPLPTLWATSGL